MGDHSSVRRREGEKSFGKEEWMREQGDECKLGVKGRRGERERNGDGEEGNGKVRERKKKEEVLTDVMKKRVVLD